MPQLVVTDGSPLYPEVGDATVVGAVPVADLVVIGQEPPGTRGVEAWGGRHGGDEIMGQVCPGRAWKQEAEDGCGAELSGRHCAQDSVGAGGSLRDALWVDRWSCCSNQPYTRTWPRLEAHGSMLLMASPCLLSKPSGARYQPPTPRPHWRRPSEVSGVSRCGVTLRRRAPAGKHGAPASLLPGYRHHEPTPAPRLPPWLPCLSPGTRPPSLERPDLGLDRGPAGDHGLSAARRRPDRRRRQR